MFHKLFCLLILVLCASCASPNYSGGSLETFLVDWKYSYGPGGRFFTGVELSLGQNSDGYLFVFYHDGEVIYDVTLNSDDAYDFRRFTELDHIKVTNLSTGEKFFVRNPRLHPLSRDI